MKTGEQRDEVGAPGLVAGQRGFVGQPRLGNHRLFVQVHQLARRLGRAVLLANARLDLDQRRGVLVARLPGAGLALTNRRAVLTPENAGSLKSTLACHIGGIPPWLK